MLNCAVKLLGRLLLETQYGKTAATASPANDKKVNITHVAETHETPDTVTGMGRSRATLLAGTRRCVVSLLVRFIIDRTYPLLEVFSQHCINGTRPFRAIAHAQYVFIRWKCDSRTTTHIYMGGKKG